MIDQTCRHEDSMALPPPQPHDDHVPDIEILNPQHYCPTRQATLVSATFALVARIVGGGILSIPLAFEKCGLVLATVLILFSIVTTDFSLYIHIVFRQSSDRCRIVSTTFVFPTFMITKHLPFLPGYQASGLPYAVSCRSCQALCHGTLVY